MITTEGIVFRSIKYGETSLILDIYTKDKGLVSCIAGGVRKKRAQMHASTLQLLQPVKISLYYKDGDHLSRLKEAHPIKPLYNNIEHPVKRVIILFLAELVQKSIREKEFNPELYNYLFQEVEKLDNLENGIGDFHLLFMINLTRFLGFFPHENYSSSNRFFDLDDGSFVTEHNPRQALDEDESALLCALISSAQKKSSEMKLNGAKRRILLNALIRYYQYHISGFGKMKSPEIIHVILS